MPALFDKDRGQDARITAKGSAKGGGAGILQQLGGFCNRKMVF